MKSKGTRAMKRKREIRGQGEEKRGNGEERGIKKNKVKCKKTTRWMIKKREMEGVRRGSER